MDSKETSDLLVISLGLSAVSLLVAISEAGEVITIPSAAQVGAVTPAQMAAGDAATLASANAQSAIDAAAAQAAAVAAAAIDATAKSAAAIAASDPVGSAAAAQSAAITASLVKSAQVVGIVGAGPIVFAGAVIADRVLMVDGWDSGTGNRISQAPALSASFEAAISVNGQIQQIDPANLSANTYRILIQK